MDGGVYYNVVRISSPFTADYTAAGETPGYIIARAFQVTSDAMLVCVFLWPQSDNPQAWLEAETERLGLNARMGAGTVRIGETPLQTPEETKLLHTVVEASRTELIRAMRQDPARYFQAMPLFFRVGGSRSTLKIDDEMRSMVTAHRDQCQIAEGLMK